MDKLIEKFQIIFSSKILFTRFLIKIVLLALILIILLLIINRLGKNDRSVSVSDQESPSENDLPADLTAPYININKLSDLQYEILLSNAGEELNAINLEMQVLTTSGFDFIPDPAFDSVLLSEKSGDKYLFSAEVTENSIPFATTPANEIIIGTFEFEQSTNITFKLEATSEISINSVKYNLNDFIKSF